MAAGAVPPREGTPGPRVGGSAPAKHARGCAVLMTKGGRGGQPPNHLPEDQVGWRQGSSLHEEGFRLPPHEKPRRDVPGCSGTGGEGSAVPRPSHGAAKVPSPPSGNSVFGGF